MARTFAEIRDEILAEKAAQTALNGLTSSSQTAIWRLWVEVIALIQYLHEQLWDSHKAEIETLLLETVAGSKPWYVKTCFDYQDGGTFVVSPETGKPTYTAPGTKIIYRAAAQESGMGVLRIKVAKDVGSGVPGPLSAPELARFTAYINQVKFAGTRSDVISVAADQLITTLEIDIDATQDQATVEAAVYAAYAAYLAGLAFPGRIYVAKIMDAIQAVPGVVDVSYPSCQIRQGGGSPVSFTGAIDTFAGYVVADAVYPPVDTFTFNLVSA